MAEFDKAEEAGLIIASQENSAEEILALNEGRPTGLELDNLSQAYADKITDFDLVVRAERIFAGRGEFAAFCECCGNLVHECDCFGGTDGEGVLLSRPERKFTATRGVGNA